MNRDDGVFALEHSPADSCSCFADVHMHGKQSMHHAVRNGMGGMRMPMHYHCHASVSQKIQCSGKRTHSLVRWRCVQAVRGLTFRSVNQRRHRRSFAGVNNKVQTLSFEACRGCSSANAGASQALRALQVFLSRLSVDSAARPVHF